MPHNLHRIETADIDCVKQVVYYCTLNQQLGAFSSRSVLAFYDKTLRQTYTPRPDLRILGHVIKGNTLIVPSYTSNFEVLTPHLLKTEWRHLIFLNSSKVWVDDMRITAYTERLFKQERAEAKRLGLEQFL